VALAQQALKVQLVQPALKVQPAQRVQLEQ
jgi:hypothetical protein